MAKKELEIETEAELRRKQAQADRYLDKYFNELDKKTAAGVKVEPSKIKRIPSALEGDQYFKIYDSIDKLDNLSDMQKLRVKLGMELGYGGGLRISEMMNLRRKSVNVTSDGLVLLNFVGKGNKEGQVLLTPRASELVQQVLNSAPDMGDDTRLFPSERTVDGVLDGSTFNNRMKDAARASGSFKGEDGEARLKRLVSAHNLRHGFVTSLLRGGASISTVQQMARHADPKTTLGYSHVLGTDVKLAVTTIHPLGQLSSQTPDFTVPKSVTMDNLAQVFDADKVTRIEFARQNFISGITDQNQYRAALINEQLAPSLADNLVAESSQARSTLSAKPGMTSLEAREAGALPGTNLVPEQGTGVKNQRAAAAPVGRPFRTSKGGLGLILKTMGDSKLPVDKALSRLGNSAATFMFELENEIARGSNTAPQVLENFKGQLQRLFPDGLSFQGRFLTDILDDEGKVIAKAGSLASPHEAEAFAHALNKEGFLKPADPQFKEANKHLDALETKGNEKYQAPNTTERKELRKAVDAGGAAPFTHVEYKKDKTGNIIKVFHRNELALPESRQPFFRVGGEAGFILDDDAYKQAGFDRKDTLEWAKRKPNAEYIKYFQYRERLKQAEQAAQVKSRGGMSAGEVTKQTQKVADANRALGILQANPPPRPELSNRAGFEAASNSLLGNDFVPQVTPKAIPEPEAPKIEGPEMTAPLTDEEIEDYKKARSGRGRGVGKVGKAILPGFLGAGIGAAVSEDAVAGGIEGLFPLGFEPSAAGADSTITGAEERKARIRGFPTAMAQQEAEEFAAESVSEPRRRREAVSTYVPPSEREPSFMDQ